MYICDQINTFNTMKIDFKKRMVWMTSVALAAVVMISACNNDDGLDNRRRQQPV